MCGRDPVFGIPTLAIYPELESEPGGWPIRSVETAGHAGTAELKLRRYDGGAVFITQELLDESKAIEEAFAAGGVRAFVERRLRELTSAVEARVLDLGSGAPDEVPWRDRRKRLFDPSRAVPNNRTTGPID